MSLLRNLMIVALVVAGCSWNTSQAGIYLGVGYGGRGYYRPYYGGYGYGGYGYYRPYPLYVAPPVIVQPAPLIVQQPPVVQPSYAPSYAPSAQPPALLPAPSPVSAAASSTPDLMPAAATANPSNRQADIDAYVRQLQTGDEPTRADAVVRLGRLQAERAVGPMVKALNSDPSPKVREAAARGLGLIASSSALSALQYAAQADEDREVRHSASFAADVIRGNLRR